MGTRRSPERDVGWEADQLGWAVGIAHLGHAAQRRAVDLLRQLLRRALLPPEADAFGQRQARRDGVDVDAKGPGSRASFRVRAPIPPLATQGARCGLV